MNKKVHLIYYYILLLFLHIKLRKCDMGDEELGEAGLKFAMEIYDENEKYVKTIPLTFNLTTLLFNEYDDFKYLKNVKIARVCKLEDIDVDNEEDVPTVTLWNIATLNTFAPSAVYMNAFPIWYYDQAYFNKKSFCLRIDAVGWENNAAAEICKGDEPCPDMIVLGTDQLTKRYYNGETVNLNSHFIKYFKETGKSFDSLLNKYSYYDYRDVNNWLGIPMQADFRVLRFNKTTFDRCREKKFPELRYPPPFDYWGEDYTKTWTWEKVFEYSKMITQCTNQPGFRLYNKFSDDLKFLITICQSLNIPFFTENKYGVKKCGLRNKEYIKKLEILKDFVESHSIKTWLNKTDIKEWQSNKYPTRPQDFKPLSYDQRLLLSNNDINGFIFDVLFNKDSPDIKYAYTPGGSTFLGGAGMIITKASKYPNNVFSFIKILIDSNYPYFSLLNISITPFENVRGEKCKKKTQSRKDFCNQIINHEGVIPYYYMFNNKTEIVLVNHETKNNTKEISFQLNDNEIFNDFQDKAFVCDDHASFEDSTITYYDNYRILVPLNNGYNIILKSMRDIKNEDITEKSFNELDDTSQKCNVFDEILRVAKPLQFPYNNFYELNELEQRAPASLLFAHLYHKHNETERKTGKFEDIINECCDIVDYYLEPQCDRVNEIMFSLGDCNEGTNKRTINYLNCKKNDKLKSKIECSYIPFKHYTGLSVLIFSTLCVFIEISFLVLIIIYRHNRSICISGINFLISILVSSIALTLSLNFWIGNMKPYKCFVRILFSILGMTGVIFSFSIKSEIIVSIYNNKDITKQSYRSKYSMLYATMPFIQFGLLIIWGITQWKIEIKSRYIKFVGSYEYSDCSNGEEYLLALVFGIDYILLVLSLIISYQARNVPSEFNESKKLFIASIITAFMLTLLFSITFYDIDKALIKITALLIIDMTLLITCIIFVGAKLLLIFDIDGKFTLENSIAVVPKKTNTLSNDTDIE